MKKILIGSGILLAFGIVACKKDDSLPERFTALGTTNANIKFLNMAPGSPQINFFVNGVKSSGAAPATGNVVTGIAYPGFYPSGIAYATEPSGSVKIDATIIGSSTVSPNTTILSSTRNYDAGKFYTFAVVDTFTQAKALVVEDDPSVPFPTKAYLRIANFAADSAVNVTVLKTGPTGGYVYTKTYTNVAAQTVLPFDSLGAGAGQVFTISFARASNGAPLGSITGFAPSQTKKYTFYVRGLLRSFGTTGGFGSYTNF